MDQSKHSISITSFKPTLAINISAKYIYNPMKDTLSLVLVLALVALLVQNAFASDFEGNGVEASNQSPSQTQIIDNSANTGAINNPAPKNTLSLGSSGNGALFGQASSFPVMDSNGRVTVAPSYYSGLDHRMRSPYYENPYHNAGSQGQSSSQFYMSSENTPKFPSLLGRRARGLPTHFDPNLNAMLMDQGRNQPENVREAYYKPLSVPLSPSFPPKTEAIDQGPLAPAPKSPLEQAGWWEYLALLFGETGDATAVRLILHRLTKLAQLQLEGVEATKVQAATAFLAHHFQPLLVSSFQDFVNDPDYTRNSAMWSSDPGFSNIIRRLVDQMDFFGAQEELERIFGPNTSVAVSFGMRQPEWLRLKLIMEQVAWDLRHPNDLIGLWSSTWKLTVPQKLSILSFASNPRANTPLDLNIPHRKSILARINLITNGEAPGHANILDKESPLEMTHFKYSQLQATGNLCNALKPEAPATPESVGKLQQFQQSQSATSIESEGFKRRVSDYCELINLTPNFNQFCQTGSNYSTPIASLLAASAPLFEEKVINYVNHLERLFWAFTWVGASQDARQSLATLANQLKTLGPKEKYSKKGKRVPTGVSESIHVRLEYMQAVHASTQNNFQMTGSADVSKIFSLMNYAHLKEALSEWERVYSSVAARLEGYPGGPLLSSGEEQLLYQQARDVRIALLIYKYPRSVYVPCLSKGLLTRDPATDLTLLNLTMSLDDRPTHGATRIDPMIPEMSARSLYLRALYLAGKDLDASRVARELAALSSNGKGSDGGLVNEFLACVELCGSATRNPCAAEKTYSKLLSGLVPTTEATTQGSEESGEQQIFASKPVSSEKEKPSTAKTVYTVGKEMSSRLCRLSRNTAADALSLRYGKVLTTQATFSALKRHAESLIADGPLGLSKLKAGEAESVLPWFGSLPPAPVDEILSFAPTHKVNYVPQVGIQGVPLITVSGANQGPDNSTANAKANDKIFVLGKEYAADILTDSNGKGNSEPKTKLVNQIYQFVPNNPMAEGPPKQQTETQQEESAGVEEE